MAKSKQKTSSKQETPASGPRLVRLSAVEKALSVSRGKLTLMIDAGQIRTVRFGRSIRVPVEEIDRLVKEGAA